LAPIDASLGTKEVGVADELGDQVVAEEGNRGLSRRHMLAAAAWSVPVISIGAAAPAGATSPPPGVITIDPNVCQYTRGNTNGGLALLLHVNNPGSQAFVDATSLLLTVGGLDSQRFIECYASSVPVLGAPTPCTRLGVQGTLFLVGPGQSTVVLYTGQRTPAPQRFPYSAQVSLTYSINNLGIVDETTRTHVAVAEQDGTATCRLNDMALNPCGLIANNPCNE
jgi:hypothetical protein